MEYTEKRIDEDILQYFYMQNLIQYIPVDAVRDFKYRYRAGFEVNPNLDIEFPPDIIDLVRMHQMVRGRRCMTVLEFGVGYSTLILADAMMKNEEEFKKRSESETEDLVWNNQFEVHSIDSSKKWLRHFVKKAKKFPKLRKYINLHYSELHIGSFAGQICHYYAKIPDIIPDFIYLDGPCPNDVKGRSHGMSFKQQDRTVMAGDILRMEATLSPGTFILVDGRSNNARFLLNNFKRKWDYHYAIAENWPLVSLVPQSDADIKFEDWNEYDYTTFELVEFPLNYWNYKKLQLCLPSTTLNNYIGTANSNNTQPSMLLGEMETQIRKLV